MVPSEGLLTRSVSCYAQADAFRKEILTRPLALANSSVAQLDGALERSHAIDEIGELQTEDTKARGGLLSNNTIVQANELLKIMNGK